MRGPVLLSILLLAGSCTRTVLNGESQKSNVRDLTLHGPKLESTSGIITVPDLGIVMIPINPGSFTMGTDSGYKSEKPAHRVTLTKKFWIGRTEITQAQYASIMGANPSKFIGKTNPVENVSWIDAAEFCKKLTVRERRAGRLSEGLEYRLPTEAQWEYCCRAGTTTRYSFGDDETGLSDQAWYNENSEGRTHPVASKKPNPWGLYDMYGNVTEWCMDWRGDYTEESQVDPKGAPSGFLRVGRGGNWYMEAKYCDSAGRGGGMPKARDNGLGFRLVMASVSHL